MMKLKYALLTFFVLFLFVQKSFCANSWNNDLRTLFQGNGAVIYAINIRTFNATDKNGDGIIQEETGEKQGNFLNAVKRLDELSMSGVNTIQLLPVTPVGKIKALGTAGSLFAVSDFGSINPQLKSSEGVFSVYDEMGDFIDECHKRNIRVIVDLPSCGSYDLYLSHPELFLKDKNQNPVTPADWTDVRLFDVGSDAQINTDVYNLYKNFVDLMISLDVDGIRADMAGLKPYSFWKNLIDYTRDRNPQFLFLAETYDAQKSPCSEIEFTSYEKLLDAGFDGYYGKYSELKNWKNASDLISNVKADIAVSKKYEGTKGVLGNFATHDQISPVLVNGPQFSKMIIWLSATLPLNSYYLDGFSTGDDYIYSKANKKAAKTFTDDDYYFVHRGQPDIFNFSRKPQGKYTDIFKDFVMANKLKSFHKKILVSGNFVPLRTNIPCVFAYARSYQNESMIVIGNLDFKKIQNATIFVPKISNEYLPVPIKMINPPEILKGKINSALAPGEIQVFYIKSLEVK